MLREKILREYEKESSKILSEYGIYEKESSKITNHIFNILDKDILNISIEEIENSKKILIQNYFDYPNSFEFILFNSVDDPFEFIKTVPKDFLRYIVLKKSFLRQTVRDEPLFQKVLESSLGCQKNRSNIKIAQYISENFEIVFINKMNYSDRIENFQFIYQHFPESLNIVTTLIYNIEKGNMDMIDHIFDPLSKVKTPLSLNI